jgi:hypothetical protein
MRGATAVAAGRRPSCQETEVEVVDDRTRVLLILSRDVVDRARVFAGKTTIALKLPVSLQIVLRALIEEGLKRDDDPALLANVAGQARAVRHKRTVARRQAAEVAARNLRPGNPPGMRERRPQQRRRVRPG